MAKKIDYQKAREELRHWLVKYTLCDIQGGIVNGKMSETGWSCGICFINLLTQLGLDSKREEYHEHNKLVNRANEVCRAILQIREAKL